MSQTDGQAANQTPASYRLDVNSILDSIFTLSSGPTAPSVTYDNQLWADTANNLLKKRNTADTFWIIIGQLNSDGLLLTNAGNPNGTRTGNYEGEPLYDTTNGIAWFYSGSGTIWNNAFGSTAAVIKLPSNYHDIKLTYLTAATFQIDAGSRVRSSDDSVDIVFSSNTTVNITTSGVNGLDTGSEAANTWYYLYAIYNPATLTSALILSTVNESDTGSITLPSGYTKKRQLKFAVRNDASSDFKNFEYFNNGKILYNSSSGDGIANWGSVTNTLGAGLTSTSFVDLSAAAFIPAVSRLGIFTGYSGGGDTLYLRKKGLGSNQVAVGTSGSTAVSTTHYGMEVPTDASQVIQYKKSSGIATVGVGIAGFYVTEVL